MSAKKKKVAKEADASQDGVSDADGEETPTKKGPGSILIIAAAVLVCAGAGAGSYFLIPSRSTPAPDETELADANADAHTGRGHGEADDAHAAAAEDDRGDKPKKKKKKKKGGHGEENEESTDVKPIGIFTAYDGFAYYEPDPFIISITPIGRSKHLKISLAIETSTDTEAAFYTNALRIKDVLNTYLRAVDATVFEDPSAMAALRAQIKRRIKLVVAPAPVTDILITEFILT